MSDIFEKYAALRAAFPEDIATIEQEERRVADLLKKQQHYLLPATQELIALCRRDIIGARLRLAKERPLPEEQRAGLWGIIDARQWVLDMIGQDYESELSQIERDLEAELSR
jgi:hypothetical protein